MFQTPGSTFLLKSQLVKILRVCQKLPLVSKCGNIKMGFVLSSVSAGFLFLIATAFYYVVLQKQLFLLGANTYLSPNKMADTDNLNPTPEINLDNTYSYLLEVGVIQQLKCYFLCISHQIFSGLGGVMINPLHVLKYLVPTKSIQYSTQIIHNT